MTTSPARLAISVAGLRKSYGDQVVLDGIEEMRVAGHDLGTAPEAVRAAIGVTGQFSAVDNLLTGTENLLRPWSATRG
jgi:ABC-2 type transport system ATP-binding protein